MLSLLSESITEPKKHGVGMHAKRCEEVDKTRFRSDDASAPQSQPYDGPCRNRVIDPIGR